MRRVSLLVVLLAALAAAWAFLPTAVGGAATFVITDGASMEPRVRTGDLIVVRTSSSYDVGDAIAYRSSVGATVLHRIIETDGDRYVVKGDNNGFIDADRPASRDVLGKQFLHISNGGSWFAGLSRPIVLAALAALAVTLLSGSGKAMSTRRRKRRGTVTQHAATRAPRVIATLPPPLRAAGAVTAAAAVAGIALGALAWGAPLTTMSTVEQQTRDSMTFSYSAEVPQTAAYDGTTVASPSPVFRKLTDTLDVRFAYRGQPGTVSVVATISTANGWRATVPLAADSRSGGGDHEQTVRLDLAALEDRANAAAHVIGLPADELVVAVTPQVRTDDGANIAPSLTLKVTPLQVALAGEESALVVERTGTAQGLVEAPRTIGLHGVHVAASTGRVVSAGLLLLAAVAAVGMTAMARRSAPANEGAAIRRQYGALLVSVHPMPIAPGRPVVDVTDIAKLAKVAERYGLLVLHWERSGVETFVVQDEAATYRYRTGSGQHPREQEPATSDELSVS
jgi:signal peptidase I